MYNIEQGSNPSSILFELLTKLLEKWIFKTMQMIPGRAGQLLLR